MKLHFRFSAWIPLLSGVLLIAAAIYQPAALLAPPMPALAQTENFQVYLPLITAGESKEITPTPTPAVTPDPTNPARAAAKALWVNEYLPSNDIPDGWTGNVDSCSTGDTSQAFKDAILQRINYFRVAAGIPPLDGLNPTYNQKAQAAIVMMVRNDRLSHQPGEDWLCYTPAGAAGAGSSNLYLSYYGPDAITGYMEDPGSGNYFVGHRRWILFPKTREMGTGDIPQRGSYWSGNALYIMDSPHWSGPRPAVRDDFIAWPPKGYIPYQVTFKRWSFSHTNANFANTTVTVTSNGANIPITILELVPPPGSNTFYGENTLVWEINSIQENVGWLPPSADTTYTVSVQNVVIQGETRNFTYDVIVFDPDL